MRFVIALRVFFPFALAYLLTSIFRSINSVIAPHIVRDLGLGPSELGFAIAALFLASIVFQLPYGVLLDRYDPKRLYAILLVLCALGVVLTALAQELILLTVGRTFVALGTTASFVTMFRVYSMWYPPRHLPLANGLGLGAGGLGLMAGTVPVEVALTFMDWRDVHLVIAALLVASAAIILIFAPDKAVPKDGSTLAEQIKGLTEVLRSALFWRVAPMLCVLLGTFSSFSTLWAGPWVRDVAGLTDLETAHLLLVLTASMTVAGLVTGPLTGAAKKIGLTPTGFGVAVGFAHAAILAILYFQWIPSHGFVVVVWALIGAIAMLSFVFYAALAPQFPVALAGRLNACITLSWMLGGFVFQNLYGIVLDQFPSVGASYDVVGHRVGTGIFFVLMLAALAWYFVAPRLLPSLHRQ